MKQEELADCLQSRTVAAVCQRQLKSNLQKKFQCMFEGIAKAGNPTLLNRIYTELYITEGGTADVNDEHEVRQIETASRKPHRPETTIRQEDIFKASPGRDEPIRRVLTKGVAGIGKTVLTQKFTLDWAEDKANQDIQFTFPFTFRELNVLKEKKFSLMQLVHHFFTETKEIRGFEEFQVVFIFDGLDECRLPLDFHNTEILTDVTESTSVDVLLTNLIRGKLLPSARLWITTRPAAANQIPPECVDMVREVRGFTDPQKEEYFGKRFRDVEQASRIISHIKTSRSLHIMCHIPVFCWITATVLEDVLKTRKVGELPKSLTEMYIHFLVIQSKVKNIKYDGGAETDSHWTPEGRKMIESLGKLAFEQLQKENLIFYDSDLTECGLNITAASVYSGVFTQIFKAERGLYQDKVFCFVHLSVQEFLAALHVHLTFINSGVNLLAEGKQSKLFRDKREPTYLFQSAVDEALQSPNGHLDLFLHFLLGLSLQTNQTLLRGLMTHTGSISQTNQETVEYIKEKISDNLSPERSINLFHCLNELNDGSLVEEIQQYLRSGSLSTNKLSPAQWSALVFILLSSKEDLDVFDLKKYSTSEEALLRLLPVVKASNKAL
uniref:NACHT domain-containing protein n=2 Tax=Sparus aurata TaxID=8175 RepID=A0A671TDC5_SPAAU